MTYLFLDYLISAFFIVLFLSVIIITVLHGRYIKKKNEEQRNQLLTGLAHDIRTPLTVIRGYTEGIIDGVADTEEKKKAYLLQIRSKSLEMESLLSDMMLFTTASSSGIRYELEKIELLRFLSEYTESKRSDLLLRDTMVGFSYDQKEELFISADREYLKRVFDNIIENSVKYKKRDTCTVRIEVHKIKDEVEIAISDDGSGIAKEELPMIFECMYRGSARGTKVSGSGVGLWLVKKITEDFGGSVAASSKPGEGTTITIRLKAA